MKTADLSQLIIELYDKISSWEQEVVRKRRLVSGADACGRDYWSS